MDVTLLYSPLSQRGLIISEDNVFKSVASCTGVDVISRLPSPSWSRFLHPQDPPPRMCPG